MTDGPKNELKVSFLTSHACQSEWAQYMLDTEPDIDRVARREKLIGALVGIPSALFFGTICGVFVGTRDIDTKRFGVVAGVIMAIPLVMYFAKGGPWYKYRESLLRMIGGTAVAERSITVSIEPDGVRVSDELSSTVHLWKSFDRVIRLPWHLAINFAHSGGAVVIPISAFSSEAIATRWEQAVREGMDAAGYSEAARVRAEIDSGPVSCGRCGQSLRGIRDPRCPECGTPLTVLTVRAWRALQQPFWRNILPRKI